MIWRSVRALRLVRVRHQRDLALGHASTNLASLPEEILQIIEDMIVKAVQPEILATAPLYFELDDCCLDALADIFQWEPYDDAWSEYATAHNFNLGNEDDWTKALSEFRETAVAKQLESTCLDIHSEEDICDTLEKEIDFWLRLPRSGIKSADAYDLNDLVG